MSDNENRTHPSDAPLRSLKILIVDDIFINHIILESILQDQGHRVESAKTGLAAVEAATRQEFDLILMDINMPVMDGKAATRLIRELPGPNSKIPIIACTADMEEDHIKDYRDSGLSSVICKPIVKQDLLDALNDFHNSTLGFPDKITGQSRPDSNTDHRTEEILGNLLKEISG
ncbi:MAG: hypothetical protein COB54_01420 [Alphaproteobacteria bacterium]|nr:MAG: hypothetical protein COB54_01420 [Alphaproteobacteria bacterium]